MSDPQVFEPMRYPRASCCPFCSEFPERGFVQTAKEYLFHSCKVLQISFSLRVENFDSSTAMVEAWNTRVKQRSSSKPAQKSSEPS